VIKPIIGRFFDLYGCGGAREGEKTALEALLAELALSPDPVYLAAAEDVIGRL
jgi:hypothetical protein